MDRWTVFLRLLVLSVAATRSLGQESSHIEGTQGSFSSSLDSIDNLDALSSYMSPPRNASGPPGSAICFACEMPNSSLVWWLADDKIVFFWPSDRNPGIHGRFFGQMLPLEGKYAMPGIITTSLCILNAQESDRGLQVRCISSTRARTRSAYVRVLRQGDQRIGENGASSRRFNLHLVQLASSTLLVTYFTLRE